MEAILVICATAFIGSGLTLVSGFGLGTLLVPVFGLFFPIEVAISLTAIVHFLNNLFKLALVGKNADKGILIRFGIPSIFAAVAGAYLLTRISDIPALYEYQIGESNYKLLPVKMVIGSLLAIFALLELWPTFRKLEIHSRYLPFGGVLSGFFGGLSGNQGALRSAFLIKSGLAKEAYIGTGVVLACFIDISRLTIYGSGFTSDFGSLPGLLLILATLSAFAGAWIGNKWLKKTTFSSVRTLVTLFLLAFAIALFGGFI